MKSLFIFSVALIILLLPLFCCKKQDASATLLTGRWQIVTDLTFEGVGINNRAVEYKGTSDDYVDFNDDGHVYIHEHSMQDTLAYSKSQDSLFVLNFNWPYTGFGQLQSSSTTLKITTGYFFTPGGIIARTIFLSK